MICAGSNVRFIAHGETGMVYTVVTRDGDDCQLLDERQRVLFSVPVELLVDVSFGQDADKTLTGARGPIRAVDEFL